MEENKNQLFRQKSIDKIESPESLNEYLHVTSPGVWLLLISLLVIFIGVAVWGIFGTIDATTSVAVVKQNSGTICLVPEEALDSIIANPEVEVNGKTLKLKPDTLEPLSITEDVNVYILLAGELSSGDVVYPIPVDGTIKEDVEQGTVVTETIRPISFLLN